MKIILSSAAAFLVTAILSSTVMGQASLESFDYTFTDQSIIRIEGTSSLHDWHCDASPSMGSFSATYGPDGTLASIAAGKVSVSVKSIDCRKNRMDRKLRDALKAESSPDIVFILKMTDLQPPENNSFEASLSGALSMAGTSQDVTITVVGIASQDGSIQFQGNFPLKMTDFGIKPPKALLGTLTTGNDVNIFYEVVATPSDEK